MTPTLRETQQKLQQVSRTLKEIAESLSQSSMRKKQEALFSCVDDIKSACDSIELSINFMYFGQKSGGQRSTAKKTRAVQENGKKGGRPSKKAVVDFAYAQNEEGIDVRLSDGTQKFIAGTVQNVREAFPPSRYKWEEGAEALYQKLTAR